MNYSSVFTTVLVVIKWQEKNRSINLLKAKEDASRFLKGKDGQIKIKIK